jgi:serine/threonine protein phosphatase 1
MIDRGNNSPAVLNWFMHNGYSVMGNHEDMWLSVSQDLGAPYRNGHVSKNWQYTEYAKFISQNGMDDTLTQLISSGVAANVWLDYFSKLPHMITIGDYLIVHAGVNPDLQFSRQHSNELLWIRGDFMSRKTKPFTRMNKRLIVGHNETFRMGAFGFPIFREDAIFIDIGAARKVGLGAFCLNTADFVVVSHPEQYLVAPYILAKFPRTQAFYETTKIV